MSRAQELYRHCWALMRDAKVELTPEGKEYIDHLTAAMVIAIEMVSEEKRAAEAEMEEPQPASNRSRGLQTLSVVFKGERGADGSPVEFDFVTDLLAGLAKHRFHTTKCEEHVEQKPDFGPIAHVFRIEAMK